MSFAKHLAIGATLLSLLVGSVASVAAQEKEISKEHRKAAYRAMLATKSTRSFDEILPLMAQRAKDVLTRSNPSLADEIDTVTTEVALSLVDRRTELSNLIQGVWARRFTLEELNAISDFYESPVGKKLSENSETIAAISFAAAKKWGDEISALLIKNIREELQKRGHKI